MVCASNRNQDGFTLVEISIVMIIIGLLIGGTFGGMKLIENMQVNRTVQDLKAIESAALTFKDTYGRLPGDIANSSARLPNCTVAPCATGGNGDRQLDAGLSFTAAIVATNERFTFWSHIQAADLLSMNTKNITDMNFGEGQPDSPVGGGYRITTVNDAMYGIAGERPVQGAMVYIHDVPSALYAGSFTIPCQSMQSIDQKMDDGLPFNGLIFGNYCWSGVGVVSPSSPYDVNNSYGGGHGALTYDLKGF